MNPLEFGVTSNLPVASAYQGFSNLFDYDYVELAQSYYKSFVQPGLAVSGTVELEIDTKMTRRLR